jgi:hypothetical protein
VWGSRRFLLVFFGTCSFSAIVTCLLALLDSTLLDQVYLGSWPLDAALTIAWGLHFPTRVIRIYFVIPVSGRILAWGTVVLTAGYAVFYGWQHLVPVLAAEGGMLVYLFRGPVKKRWLRFRLAALERELAAEQRAAAAAGPDSSRPSDEPKRPQRPMKPSDLN